MRRPTRATPAPSDSAAPRARRVHRALWLAQAVRAARFLFGGGSELVLPGLLPRVFRRRAALTALAAAGLVLLMCGAVGATLASAATAATPALALVPAAVGAPGAMVAYGRGRLRLSATAASARTVVADGLPVGAPRPAAGHLGPAVRRSA